MSHSEHHGPGPERPMTGKRAGVLTRPFLLLLSLTFVGFAYERIFQVAIPLLIVERGGDAVLVGLIAGVHSIPSVMFRPTIGRLVDTWRHGLVLRWGALIAAVAPVGVLFGGIPELFPLRFFQGTGWSLYSVSTHALLGKLAPPNRRGEAAGYYMVTPALAGLVAPAAGVALFLTFGAVGLVLVGCGLGAMASVAAFRSRVPDEAPRAERGDGTTGRKPSRAERLVEPSALPATLVIATFMSSQALFAVFPPLYAISVGAPLETLAVYYPVVGVLQVSSQLLAGRASDRFGRRAAICLGSGLAAIGLGIAAVSPGMLFLTIGGGAYAVAQTLVTPTASALTIDRAPAHRLGAAVATYSLGYQLALGAGSLLWGAVIAAAGFQWAFLGAIGFKILTAATALRFAGAVRSGGRTDAGM